MGRQAYLTKIALVSNSRPAGPSKAHGNADQPSVASFDA